MMRSTHRILTTHAGSLPRPDDVRALVTAKAGGQPARYRHQSVSTVRLSGARVRAAAAAGG